MEAPRAEDIDLLIIGGGVNGAGIARDAAGRGLSVLLCEQGDLAGATSSASSKLIHGGLRYLEYYDFRLVREALAEREVLLAAAPHIIWPVRFILPYEPGTRPAWMIRLGLFLYDWLGPRKRLPGSRGLKLRDALEGAPLKRHLTSGFSYFDCSVDDARLVALNALDARERGADIRTRTRFVSARRELGGWQVALRDERAETEWTLTARALVNAAGPWAAQVLNQLCPHRADRQLRLVKGSHIIAPRLYAGAHAYILQNQDRRVVFVMPYGEEFSLIGTTELPFAGDPSSVAISAEEIAYLCAAASHFFQNPLRPEDIVGAFSGVRPLYDDKAANASAITRDYVLDLDALAGSAPMLSVLGGKLTTYRRLAERAVGMLTPYLEPARPNPWTRTAPLPGGDMEGADFDLFLRRFHAKHGWLPLAQATRLARAYGTRAELILDGARAPKDLGMDFGGGLFQAEIDYLMDQEWALTGEDVLWRRSKLGLRLTPNESARVAAYVNARANASTQEREHDKPQPSPRD